MEKDPLQNALLDWESEGGSIIPAPPERTRVSPADAEPALDPRHRRGSLGPPPAARPLPGHASGAALQAHLVRLLDYRRDLPVRDPALAITDYMPTLMDAAPVVADPALATTDYMPTMVEAAPVTAAPPQKMVDAISLPTPHEDVDRQPDGVPHLVIGLTALSSVLLAAVLIGAFLHGPSLGSISAAVLAILAVPVTVFWLGARAERDRDRVHPSR